MFPFLIKSRENQRARSEIYTERRAKRGKNETTLKPLIIRETRTETAQEFVTPLENHFAWKLS